MTSEEEDDTLPLPGLSQEPFVDVTVDEDFIPTSQPKSFAGTKMTKIPEAGELDEGKDPDSTSGTELLPSVIDDTIPAESVADEFLRQHISANFIEDADMKKTAIELTSGESLFSEKSIPESQGCTNELESQLESGWEKEMSRVPESPLLETQNFSIIEESLPYEDSLNEAAKSSSSVPVIDKTAMTEIIVNDSVETVDLDVSENSSIKVEKKEVKTAESEISCSLNSEMKTRAEEETQLFDNSSALLLDQPEPLEPVSSDFPKTEKLFEAKTTQELYVCQTIDETEVSPCLQERDDNSQLEKPMPVVDKFSNGLAEKTVPEKEEEVPKQEETKVFNQEKSSAGENAVEAGDSTLTPLEIRKLDIKLHITCHVTINPKTKKVIQKLILNVNEVAKSKAKPVKVELISDNASDKRYSASSSGSVYSDKTGLPFALPKRISTISDQTDASDSSEDSGLSKIIPQESKIVERIPWKNEFLLPMKMDELMMVHLEDQNLNKRPFGKSPPKKFRNRHPNGLNNLEEVSESFSSEQASTSNSLLANGNEASELKDASEEGLKEALEKESSYEAVVSSTSPSKDKVQDEVKESGAQNVGAEKSKDSNLEGSNQTDIAKPQGGEGGDLPEGSKDSEGDGVELCEGLEVFARWTDKQYYSGVLTKTPKNDRWEIKFDDGTIKNIREDFVMPSKWLKVGELVFALVDDKYASGKIIKITPGEEAKYTVELDSENKQVDVKRSDLSLTEVMASIVKEKFKPLCSTPGKRTADINFDNVLSGKRLREQKTPLKLLGTTHCGNSSTTKKSWRGKRDVSDTSLTKGLGKRPLKRDVGGRLPGLQSENGHLMPDKGISAESSSTTERGETPVRERKGAKKKSKPRTLCYEAEMYLSNRKKSKFMKEGLAPDGTPIPGPSGVKFKKQKTKGAVKAKAQTPSSDNSSSSSPTEELRVPVRPVKFPESKISAVRSARSKRKSPGPPKNGEGVRKKGKRKFNVDCSEDATDDGPPAKTPAGKKGEVGRKKTKTKKD